MANQRKKNKKQASAWIPEELYSEIDKIAKSEGVPKSAIIERMIKQGLNKREGKV